MFKKVTGNDSLLISLNGKLQYQDGSECTPTVHPDTGLIEIDLYGKSHQVCPKWLALVSHYEVDLPESLRHRIFDIVFEKGKTRRRLSATMIRGSVMVFKKPFYWGKGYDFRIVPCFTRYAVDRHGTVIDTLSGDFVKPNNIPNMSPDRYLDVDVCSPAVSGKRNVRLHRLVALAWCLNPDWSEKDEVNHKDGNKLNPHYRNLEWVSTWENNEHAILTGLRNDTVACKIRDIRTGEVLEFPTTGRAFIHMKAAMRNVEEMRLYSSKALISRRWEIRLDGDERPWHYPVGARVRHNRITTWVTMSDGKKYTFYDNRDLIKTLKLWNVSHGIDSLVTRARELYPGIKIHHEGSLGLGPVQVRNVETNEVLDFPSSKKASRAMGVSQGSVKLAVAANGQRAAAGHVYRLKSDDSWPEVTKVIVPYTKCISGRNIDTGEERTFKSFREVSRFLDVDKGSVKYRIENQKPLKGWLLELRE